VSLGPSSHPRPCGHGHRAVVEDPTTYAAGSDVGVHVAVGDSGQATVGNAAGSRAADTAGRDVVVHVAIGDDERAAGAWRSAVPVAAGNAAPLAEVLPLTSLLMTLRVPERFRIPPPPPVGPSCRSPGCCFQSWSYR